jgi:hypothetical protein
MFTIVNTIDNERTTRYQCIMRESKQPHEKTIVLGFRADKHTRKMLLKIQRKYKLERAEALRQCIESTYLQEFREGKEQ